MIHQNNLLASLCGVLDCTPDEREKLRAWIDAHVVQFNCSRNFSMIETSKPNTVIDQEALRFNASMILHNMSQQKIFTCESDFNAGRYEVQINHSVLVFKP